MPHIGQMSRGAGLDTNGSSGVCSVPCRPISHEQEFARTLAIDNVAETSSKRLLSLLLGPLPSLGVEIEPLFMNLQ